MICFVINSTDKIRQYRLKSITPEKRQNIKLVVYCACFIWLSIFAIDFKQKTFKMTKMIIEKRAWPMGILMSVLFIGKVIFTLNLLFLLFLQCFIFFLEESLFEQFTRRRQLLSPHQIVSRYFDHSGDRRDLKSIPDKY